MSGSHVANTTRVSRHLDAPRAGKMSAHTDTYRGRFVQLVPDTRIVEVIEFETDDPALQRHVVARPSRLG